MTNKVRFFTDIEQMAIASYNNIEVPQLETIIHIFDDHYTVKSITYWYPDPKDAEDKIDELILIDIMIEKEVN